jgi:hypothetical protein
MWCWSKKEKTSCADRVKKEVLNRGKEERNVLNKKNEGMLTGLVTAYVGTVL